MPKAKGINTTSKLGLPSNTLLRNQHGQTRRKRHNKKRKQHTRDETDTTTIESRMWSIQAAVAYLRARSVRTLRDPANLRARSVRTWNRFSTTTKASNSSGRVLDSSGCGISSCEVSSDLARPGKYSCEVSSHLEKIYLVIEHNHQSFEQPDTTFCCSQFSETPSIPRSTRP